MREKIAQIHNNTQRSYCDVYCDDSLACNSQGGCRMPGACNIQNFLTLRLALLTNQIARILLGVVQYTNVSRRAVRWPGISHEMKDRDALFNEAKLS